MIPTSIYYERIFPIAQYVNEKIGVEATIEPGESMEEALDKAKSQVEEWHRKYEVQINPEFAHLLQPSPPAGTAVPVIQAKEEKEDLAAIIKEIKDCSSLEELKTFDIMIISKYVVPAITLAYNAKKKELTT